MESVRKKVKYSLTKYTKVGPFRYTGYGEIDNENLYTKNKVYEDCIRFCHKKINTSNEYKGSFAHYEEIEFLNYKGEYVETEVETDYDLWFRILN
ncbi:MAG: hypothetical protein IKC11_01915 [Clostridia bacterium]|nr:hypothetical protein [Clostridia bacterium]